MPELPEVETFARGLDFALKGLRIEDVFIYRKKNIRSDVDDFVATLKGATFLKVTRRGKYLLFHLDNHHTLLSHLRMEGRWKAIEEPFTPSPYALLAFTLSDTRALVYEDSRKFGTLEIKKDQELHTTPPLSELGREPLEIDFESFYNGLQSKHRPIKESLLDQHFLSGIGNIYADESLFASKIHPLELGSNLSIDQARTLYEEMKRILNLAISLRGSSIHSYVATFETEPSSMQEKLLIYGKAYSSCPRCGHTLTFTQVAGRGTTFCPLCQQRSSRPFRLAISGPIHSGKSFASQFFQEKGISVFDADEEVAKLYTKKSVLSLMKEVLGEKAVKKNQVDRAYLRNLFQVSPAKKKEWMDHLYPLLLKEYHSFEEAHKNDSLIILDIPLLFSSPFQKEFDALLLIEASEEIRKERLEKEGRDAEKLIALNASYPLKKTRKAATFIIKNEGDIPSYSQKLEELYSTIAKCRARHSSSCKDSQANP